MKKVLLLISLLFFQISQSQVRYAEYDNSYIGYKLTLYGNNTFYNGGSWPLPPNSHRDRGRYEFKQDTMYMYLTHVFDCYYAPCIYVPATNDNYGFIIQHGKDSLYAWFYDRTNGPYRYAVDGGVKAFSVYDTITALATWPNGTLQPILFTTGKALLALQPTWYGIDTMGVFREGLDSLGNRWGWIQVGTTMYGVPAYGNIPNPNNFIANKLLVKENLLLAITPMDIKSTRLDSLNFAGWKTHDTLDVVLSGPPILTRIINFLKVEWRTASEANVDKFYLQKTQDSTWVNVGTISAHGTTNEYHNYFISDTTYMSGGCCYRIKAVSFVGSTFYSFRYHACVSN